MTMSGVPCTIGDPRRRERRSSLLVTRIEMDRPVNLVRRPLYMRPTLLGEAFEGAE